MHERQGSRHKFLAVQLHTSRDICLPASEFHLMHRTRSISTGHMRLDCQEFVMSTLSLIQWAMAYRQLRGRAASLSPKSRPKVHLPARSVLCLPEFLSQPLAQCAKRTGLLMTDASHRIAKPAPQSAALYLPPFSHTGRPPSARMVFSLFCRQQHVSSFGKNSPVSWRESGI